MDDFVAEEEPTPWFGAGDAVGEARDWRVLVIGLGAGEGVDRLAGRLDHGEVIGVDPSAAMHRLAERRNRAAVRAGRLTLIVSEVDSLPLPNGWVDAASAMDTLQLATSIEAFATELARVMRPGAPFGSVTHEWAPGLRAMTPAAWLRAAAAAFEAAGFEDVAIAHGRAGGERAMILKGRRGRSRG